MTTNTTARRHLLTGFLSGLFVYIFWQTRPEWTADMRLWRAVGDASFVLLFLTLILGPLSKIWSGVAKIISWRRELGIWFAVTAAIHGLLILNGWVQWDFMRLMGYEFIPELNRIARLEPGFGLANLLGLTALFWAVVLASTSCDKAIVSLGSTSWKILHSTAYVIFYLVSLHTLYFLFIHFTLSFHRPVPPPNWFRFPSLIMVISLFMMQIVAYIKTVANQKVRKK